ncbi:MAG: peptidase [Actinomycetia bacterium]|nr:peptidase [Actinomycetes bacterium]
MRPIQSSASIGGCTRQSYVAQAQTEPAVSDGGPPSILRPVEEGDPFEVDDAPLFRTPPPPDDRLWRHPSELGRPSTFGPRRSAWPVAVASGLTGAVLTVGLLAVSGVLVARTGPREVVIREAVRSAVATVGGDRPAPDVEKIVRTNEPAIVRLNITGDDESVGSGVLFRDDGHVLTNAHVVDGARRVVAVLASGRSIEAHVIGFDTATDIAVVKLDAAGPFPTAVFGTTDGMAVGAPAIAIGSPLGLRGSSSVTVGVVSAMGRELESQSGPRLYDMIQTDAAIADGSSGGALLDRDGTLVGITTAYAVSDLGNGGLGFATPVDVARAAAEDIMAMGHVRLVWLGVTGKTAADGGGVVLEAVNGGGPAKESGLRVGDVIRRVDAHPIATMSALRVALRRRHPGDRVSIVFDRGGSRRTATVALAEHP